MKRHKRRHISEYLSVGLPDEKPGYYARPISSHPKVEAAQSEYNRNLRKWLDENMVVRL